VDSRNPVGTAGLGEAIHRAGAAGDFAEVGGLPASASRQRAATPLTKRERAVLRVLPTQLSNREIGRELYVSVNTVRSQVQAIYRKLGVTSRAEPVAHARHLRLVPGATSTDQ
jgi:DNA-binding NarL/FixJ family response regulator